MITPLYIRNRTGGLLSIDYTIGEQQIRRRIDAYQRTADLSSLITPDELNACQQFQEDRAAGKVEAEQGTAVPLSATQPGDIPAVVPAAQARGVSGAPIIDLVTGQTTSLAAVPAAKSFTGRNLRQGFAHASITFGTGTSSVIVTSQRPGLPGNFIAVALVDAASASVSVSGGAVTGEPSQAAPRTITVNYRGPLNGNADNAAAVAALINASAAANALVYAASSGGGGGNVTAASAANLAGGTGTGFRVYIGGVEQNLGGTAGVTDTNIPVRTRALPGANGDRAYVYCVSNGVKSNDFPIDIVT